MNIKDRLLHISNLNNKYRGHGLTTEMVKAAKDLHAIYLVHSFDEATRLTRLHKGLTVKSIDINLEGFAGPFILDHHAADILMGRAANKIEQLERINNDQQVALAASQNRIDNMQKEVEFVTDEAIKRGVKISYQIEEIEALKANLNLKYVLKMELNNLWTKIVNLVH